jgi:hypothetical protein
MTSLQCQAVYNTLSVALAIMRTHVGITLIRSLAVKDQLQNAVLIYGLVMFIATSRGIR